MTLFGWQITCWVTRNGPVVLEDRGIYEPLITLGALTSVTSKVKLGTAVLLPLRHPVVTASMVSTLDHASGGANYPRTWGWME